MPVGALVCFQQAFCSVEIVPIPFRCKLSKHAFCKLQHANESKLAFEGYLRTILLWDKRNRRLDTFNGKRETADRLITVALGRIPLGNLEQTLIFSSRYFS